MQFDERGDAIDGVVIKTQRCQAFFCHFRPHHIVVVEGHLPARLEFLCHRFANVVKERGHPQCDIGWLTRKAFFF
ncbi:MAG: Uncharacterised protein [Cellulomonadaceae bacterium TMED98]|nr:MAG: Uncharacterised protein [Cellulomonadaceae bacterium TMED98]